MADMKHKSATQHSRVTVQIDATTHNRLMRISEQTGQSLVEIISTAAALLEQKQFIRQLRADYRRMRENPEEWASYVEERDQWLLGVPALQDPVE